MALRDHLFFILLSVGQGIYIFVGAAIFYAIENPLEQQNVQLANDAFADFLANYTCVSEAELLSFLDVVKKLRDVGVSVGNSTLRSSWSYSSSVFFAGTVVTTVGYGSQSPTVPSSQMFCCFFLFFGIPLCLVHLAKVGGYLATINNAFVDKLVKWPKVERKRSLFSLGLLVVNGSALLVFIPSISFSYVEGWPYGTSIYFTFITLSTVGFGDYYLGQSGLSESWIYRLANGVWIFFGLAWFASIISTIQEQVAERVNKDNATDVESDVNPLRVSLNRGPSSTTK